MSHMPSSRTEHPGWHCAPRLLDDGLQYLWEHRTKFTLVPRRSVELEANEVGMLCRRRRGPGVTHCDQAQKYEFHTVSEHTVLQKIDEDNRKCMSLLASAVGLDGMAVMEQLLGQGTAAIYGDAGCLVHCRGPETQTLALCFIHSSPNAAVAVHSCLQNVLMNFTASIERASQVETASRGSGTAGSMEVTAHLQTEMGITIASLSAE
ncbi:hypothetical protein BDW67DRAFT_187630 [Aspergillus spinulosporus]